jgi:hypothetical protein
VVVGAVTEPSLLKQLRKNVRDTVLQVPDIERKLKNGESAAPVCLCARRVADCSPGVCVCVRAATNNDKWGPHAQDMAELARASFS